LFASVQEEEGREERWEAVVGRGRRRGRAQEQQRGRRVVHS
jgi:hypothetical protein